jgi:hypothetical protein
MAVKLFTERLGLEITPAQFTGGAEYETRGSDVVNKLFGIIEVGSPGDVPGDRVRTPAHGDCWPVYRRIPGCGTAGPNFAVKTADIRRAFYYLTPLSMT